MEQPKEYFAFISYKREDEEWAKWLAHELEHYHLPVTLNGRDDLPRELRPIFRDADELSAGNLPEQIHTALVNSKHLIVVCSPRAAKSEWVNKEIEEFINLGKTDKIYPFIVDGIAMSNNIDEECFPPALKNIPKEEERLGGNVNERGRDAAVIKIVAGMLNLGFDTLWNRYEREKAEEEQRKREEQERLLRTQSLFLSEKMNVLVKEGEIETARLLAQVALPRNLDNPDRPYVVEAEKAFRNAMHSRAAVLRGHNGIVFHASYSPNGQYICSASSDKTIIVWEIRTNAIYQILRGHTGIVFYAEFSPDGNYIVSSSEDNTIRIWNVKTGIVERVLKGHTDKVRTAKYSYSGDRIVSVSDDFTVKIWKADTGELLRSYNEGSIMPISAFILDSWGIFVLYKGGTIKVWDDGDYSLWKKIENEGKDFLSIVPNPRQSGQYLVLSKYKLEQKNVGASNCNSVIVQIPDYLDSFNCVAFKPMPIGIDILTYHSSPKLHTTIRLAIVTGSEFGDIHFWNETDNNYFQPMMCLKGHRHEVNSIEYSPDGTTLVSASSDRTVRIWDLTDGCLYQWGLRTPESFCKSEAQTISFSPDNQFVVTAEYSKVFIRKVNNGDVVKCLYGHNDCVRGATFNPSGDHVVTCSDDMTLIIWDAETGEVSHILRGHEDGVTFVAYSPNGKQIVSASSDKTVKVWDSKTGALIRTIDGFEDVVMCAMFSPNNKMIVASASNQIKLLNAENGQEVRTIIASDYNTGYVNVIRYVSFNSDGSQIVSASKDTTIRLWDTETGVELRVIRNHVKPVFQAMFSPDNKYILSSSYDGTAKITLVETDAVLYDFFWNPDPDPDMRNIYTNFSNDGKYIALTTTNIVIQENVRIYSFLPLDELMKRNNLLLNNHHLPDEIKQKYYLG